MNVVAIRGMNDVFELFFVQGEMIVLHTSLMILKKQELGPKVWIYLALLPSSKAQNYHEVHAQDECV